MAFEREKLQKNPQFLGQTDKKRKKMGEKNAGRKKCKFLENSRFFGQDYA